MNQGLPSDVGAIVGCGIAIAMLIALPAWTTTLFERLGALAPESSRFSVGAYIFLIAVFGGGRIVGCTIGRCVVSVKRKA